METLTRILILGLLAFPTTLVAAGYGSNADVAANLCRRILYHNMGPTQGETFCKPTKQGVDVVIYAIRDKELAVEIAARVAIIGGNDLGLSSVQVEIYPNKRSDEAATLFSRPKTLVKLILEK